MKIRRFPATHAAAVAVLGLCLCPLVIARFVSQADSGDVALLADVPAAPAVAAPIESAMTESAPRLAPAPRDSTPEPRNAASTTETLRVRRGDSLAKLFQRRGIPAHDLHRLVLSEPFGPRLNSILPGHQLTITVAPDNSLMQLSYSPGPLQTLEFSRVGERFQGIEVAVEPERIAGYHGGTIDHSLFVASQRAGLKDSVTVRLARIFQWDIDFVLDIRAGDSFHVLIEELYLGDQFVGYGDILAAEFVNRGESFRAVRYGDSPGEASYYDPDGRSLRKAFLRAPVSFTRISSNFNLRRQHPLWNRAMPHRGIDYAAPTGTPVRAAGQGKVTKVGRTQANGNYIVIRHGEQFVTKYLHLSGFAPGLRANTTVRQGQTIGYVGSTGWSTGPHLHYEFLVNGVHQNPRTVRLPDASPIPESERERFHQVAGPRLALLDSRKQNQLAYVGR